VFRTRALGTTADMVVTDGTVIVAAAEILRRELERIDRVASRFRPDSELSRLNALAGRCTAVSPDLFEAVSVALAMAEATGGLVDPTVGRAMSELGYDRDFDEVRAGRDGALPSAGPVPGWRSVTLERAHFRVGLPPNTALDLGATAKALAADRAAGEVARQLGCGVLVSLGGDAAVAGPAPIEGFPIAIADTCISPSHDEVVAVTSGGLASSGIGLRQWRLGPNLVHHIVDPRTGLPAATCWRTVSATAASCVEANAATTAAVVMGAPAAEWLTRAGIPARLVALDGRVFRTPGWPDAPEPTPTANRLERCDSGVQW
jgi:thiamine biosynthesis lipoprotein